MNRYFLLFFAIIGGCFGTQNDSAIPLTEKDAIAFNENYVDAVKVQAIVLDCGRKKMSQIDCQTRLLEAITGFYKKAGYNFDKSFREAFSNTENKMRAYQLGYFSFYTPVIALLDNGDEGRKALFDSGFVTQETIEFLEKNGMFKN